MSVRGLVFIFLLFSSESMAIIRGTPVQVGEHANVFMLTIQDGASSADFVSTKACTGTLIHPLIILTAAHCVLPSFEKISITNAVNGFRYTAPEIPIIRRARNFFGHPQYLLNEKAKRKSAEISASYDIGLIELSAPITDVPVVRLKSLDSITVTQLMAKPLELVGYGMNIVPPAPDSGAFIRNGRDIGIKNFSFLTSEYASSSRYFQFLGAEGNLAEGDSGGPTFFDEGGVKVQIGIHHAHNPYSRTSDYRFSVDNGLRDETLCWLQHEVNAILAKADRLQVYPLLKYSDLRCD